MNLPPFGDHADPRAIRDLAVDAEQAGWDGFFVWDHMLFRKKPLPVADPWVALAAVAMATERIRIGTMITPLSRRRPWVVARQAVGLDQLSGGRFILGVGLGAPTPQDFSTFGEVTDDRIRAARLDESIDLLDQMWSGRTIKHDGEHYQVSGVSFLPRPVQERIPVWVGGYWPARGPFRRAARWDGVAPGRKGGPMRPADVIAIREYIDRHRTRDTPFDFVVGGATPGEDPAAGATKIIRWADAGATWWIEDISMWRFGGARESWPYAQIVERVRQGPPRVP